MSQNEWNAPEVSVVPYDIEALVAPHPKTRKTDKKNPIVIYHANCADGFSAAWVFYKMSKIHEVDFEFYAGVYGKPPPDVTDRIVYLVDFSYKRDVVIEMCQKAAKVILIDHHKTAIEDLGWLVDEGCAQHQRNFNWYVDIERSGAVLAWDYWFIESSPPTQIKMGPRPILLGHVEDRDLWRFKLPNTREIQANVFSYEYTFENWDKLMSANQAELLKMTVAGAAIERKHHKDIAELVKVCQRLLVIGGHVVPVASLPYTLTSDAGHLMASDWKDGELFAACYWDTSEERIFSLRSTDNGMDVSAVALQYGGGGHKHAAGFKVPRGHWLATA